MAGNAAHDYEVRDAINQVVDASRKLLDTQTRPIQRDQHPKQHGCVRARFVVAKNLESQYRQGLFQEPRYYDAWIRLSNGAHQDDRKPDAHGMGVKLMGVAGPKVLAAEQDATTQDFVLVDNPTFIVRNALAYRRFSNVLLKAAGKAPSAVYNMLGLVLGESARFPATLLLLSLTPKRFPPFLRLMRFASKRIANPVTTRYWSTTPYRFGDTCVKFSAVPADFPGGPPADGPIDKSYEALADFLRPVIATEPVAAHGRENSPDYLREALARTLAVRGAVFLFQVQLFRDDGTTPIEDPTVEWPEEAAPFHTVGWIWIPKQVCDTPGRMAFGENLSFTPWHTIAAHEPLGEINLVRKHVYSKLSTLRHALNGVVPREPEVTDPDPTSLPPRWGDDPSAFWHVLEDELQLIIKRRRHLEALRSESDSTGNRPPAAAGSSELAKVPVNSGSPSVADRDVSAESLGVDGRTRQARLRALHEHTTGLALAGDGQSGATFSIGFLQGLASLGLIRRLDYISAVTGGSPAVAWLAAWLKREGDDPRNVERQLDPSRIEEARARRQYLTTGEVVDVEPQPLRHLRAHAGPRFVRSSAAATDEWPQILGNLLIHGLVLVPLLMLLATGARLLIALYAIFNGIGQIAETAGAVDRRLGVPVLVAGVIALAMLVLVALVALGVALSSIATALREFRTTQPGPRIDPSGDNQNGPLNRRIVLSLLMASLLLSFCVRPITRWIMGLIEKSWSGPNTAGLFSFRTLVEVTLPDLTVLSWPNFVVHAMILGPLLAWWAARVAAGDGAARRQKFIAASLTAGVTGGVLLVLLEGLFHHFSQLGRFDLLATLVPPLALLIAVAAMVVVVAIVGRAASDAELAWWAGAGGLLTKSAIYWTAAMATIFYLPGVVYAAGGLARTLFALAWLATPAFGLLAVRYVPPRGGWLLWWASAAAGIFFSGLLGATALIVSLFANVPSLTAPGGDDINPFTYYLQGIEATSRQGVEPTSIAILILLAAGFGILYALARRLIDVNLFSLGAVDAQRLTRCYLAASRPIAAWRRRWRAPRDQRVRTGAPSLSGPAAEQALVRGNTDSPGGLDVGDDIELRALCIGRANGDAPVYWGPQLVFNTTMIACEHDAFGRHFGAESFTLSPLYCGAASVGYAPTENSSRAGVVHPNLWLGRVAALAGSAGEPRMAPPSRALLTLFSARAGSWIEKPRLDGWAAASPRFADLPVAASFGLDDVAADYLYLTGGAEFERLGVYELVRRRCRFIIAVDAGHNGAAPGANLAQLVRRCRIDFGIRIEIDDHPLPQPGPDGLHSAHCTTGKVHYGDVDEGEPPGEFIYVTMAVTGDEPPHVQDYARNLARSACHPSDFWRTLDDAQFESGRYLGEHAARAVFGEAACRASEHDDDGQNSHAEYVRRLFAAVTQRPGDSRAAEAAQAPAPAQPLPAQGDEPREVARLAEPGGEVQPEPEPEPEPPPPPPAGGRGRGRGTTQPGGDGGSSRRS